MVAVVIGMVASIVVLQLFTDSENRNRTSASSADAQSNGIMTLYQLQSNIARAGYGISSTRLINCNVTWQVGGADITEPLLLAPVSINPKDASNNDRIPAGDDNTDVLVVVYGNSDSQPEGNEISATSGSVYTVRTQSMFAVGDRVIAAPDTCGTTNLVIDRVTDSDAVTSEVTTNVGGAGRTLFALGAGPDAANQPPTTAMPTNGPSILVYAVRNGSLTVCDFSISDCSKPSNTGLTSVWAPIASNIVSMRAAYWRDNSAAWDGATAADIAINQTQPTTACEWARVRGIHVALVSRSEDRDKVIVTGPSGVTPVPTWSSAALNAAAPIDLTLTDPSWERYRYRAFEALVPLRNVTWMGSPPTGC